MDTEESGRGARPEIYTYTAPWTVYSLAWSRTALGRAKFRMAVGSFKEEYSNQVSIIQLVPSPNSGATASLIKEKERVDKSGLAGAAAGEESLMFECKSTFDHNYPPTKVAYAPSNWSSDPEKDLIATTGDYLRLWSADNSSPNVVMKALLNNNKHTEYCAPVTSFDWNETDPNMIGTCSIDTTCTIWDIEREVAKTQLIAHDKEVYDIGFANDKNIFSTVGADGSLRIFDLRSLEHSTILYESPGGMPLLRLAWNKADPHFIATIMSESSSTIILDIRMPSLKFAELSGHDRFVNSIAWAPHSPSHISTAADDRQALIWDIFMPSQIDEPALAYTAAAEINNIQWSSAHEDYVGIAYTNHVQFLKV